MAADEWPPTNGRRRMAADEWPPTAGRSRQVVWVGDFNFRLAGLTREAAVGLVAQARGLLY